MKITKAILDDLTTKAKASPRRRMNMDLRNGIDDQSQRMLNAIEPDSVVPIHRHQKTSETVVCLRGRVVEEYYDEQERICTETIELTPNGLTVALNIPPGQWHTIRSLESGSVILEVKDGKFEPLSDVDILQKYEGKGMMEDVLCKKRSISTHPKRGYPFTFLISSS